MVKSGNVYLITRARYRICPEQRKISSATNGTQIASDARYTSTIPYAILNSQLFLYVFYMIFHVKNYKDFHNPLCSCQVFIPCLGGQICIYTFFNHSYEFCCWFLFDKIQGWPISTVVNSSIVSVSAAEIQSPNETNESQGPTMDGPFGDLWILHVLQ